MGQAEEDVEEEGVEALWWFESVWKSPLKKTTSSSWSSSLVATNGECGGA